MQLIINDMDDICIYGDKLYHLYE